jgi:hypothetical protein
MIVFKVVDIAQVLQIYQELANRTLIQGFPLRSPSISIHTYTPLTRSEACYALGATFALNGISIIPAGDKFLFVVPTISTNIVANLIATLPKDRATSKKGLLAAGMINLQDARLPEVAAVYSGLCDYKVEATAGLPPRFTLRNVTPLTGDEALYALDLSLGLQGHRVEREPGDGPARIVP